MHLAILRDTLWGRGHAAEVPSDRIEAAGRVPRGLSLLPNFVPKAGQDEIAAWIAAHVPWSCSGYCGNRRETFMPSHNPLPEWGEALGRRMVEAGFFEALPDHLHLIEYCAGGGFPFHRDCDEIGAVISGLTLGSSRVIEFRREEGPATDASNGRLPDDSRRCRRMGLPEDALSQSAWAGGFGATHGLFP